MLDLLRKKAQSPLIQATILIIALVFIFWGVGGYRNTKNSVAQVNDDVITYEAFQKTYERLSNQFRDQFGGNIPKGLLENLDLEGQAVEQLIQRSLLRQGAREMGIRVSDLEVRQAVEKMEAFRTNGAFNVAQYKNILSSSGMTPASFEDTMRTDLLAGKVIEYLSEFAKLTPLEINNQFNYDNEEIKIEYVSFSGSDFKKTVRPDEEQLQSYYEENKENYMTEPQVKLHFLVFPYTQEGNPISDEVLESYYQQNINRFTIPEQRSARHILIKTSADDTEDILNEKRQRAAQILELARSGEDFAELAKQYSEGPTAPRGGDLGTFSRGQMVKPFEDAVFSLKEKGQISDIVETPYGFHIIKLEKIEPAHVKPFAEVKDQIKAGIQEQKSRELAFTAATQAYEDIIRAGSLDKFGQQSDIRIDETDFFSRKSPEKSGSKVPMLTDPDFLNAAFSLNKGELSSIVETPKGYAIIFAADRKDPEIAPYQKVADQVREDYIISKAEEMAQETAESMLSALKDEGGKNFSAVAEKFHKSPKSSSYITRSDSAGAKLPQEIVSQGLELSEKNPYPGEPVTADGMFYVFKVLEKRPPSSEIFSRKESAFKTELLERKKAAILASWLANVREKATIEINQQFL